MNDKAKNNTDGTEKQATIKGQIDHITFQNDETGYIVARLVPDNHPIPITIVGNIPGLRIGEYLEINGRWIRHPKFGPQVEIDSFKPLIPASIKGIENYLGSGVIPGIGPITARKIVNHFKENTLTVLNENPQKIIEVPGIGRKTAPKIVAAWKESSAIRDTMIFLQEHDLSPNLAMRIIKEYGDSALNKLRENPYYLADDLFGVGFKKADEVARKLGMALDDPRRLEGAMKYILSLALNDGHCYLEMFDIIERGRDLLDLPTENLEEIIERLIVKHDLTKDDDAVYLPAYFTSEERSAKLVAEKLSRPPDLLDETNIYHLLEIEEARAGYSLNEDQRKAVVLAMNSPFMILTGGPGTGKSTAMHFLVRLAEQSKKRVLLASPTGRAAKRLEETTGRAASTIHRLLEYNPHAPGNFMRNADAPLDGDLLIVDEASMIDLVLFYNLLKAVPSKMQVLLVGDPDQLPSVGAGNVLKDLLNVCEIDRIILMQIFRQAEKSMIIRNAHRIITGRKILLKPDKNMEQDFRFISEPDPQKAAEKIVEIIQSKFSANIDPIRDIQVLSPMHNGPSGAKNLNQLLQEALNQARKSTDEIDYYGRKFRIGDRVMQIRNNYDKDIFNGDIGFIENVDTVERRIHVMFDRLVIYEARDLDELIHAYAVTIHKSQGSEYPVVIMPILNQHFVMLRRNLLYTGITRARKLAVIIGSQQAVEIAIRRDDVGHRNTKLAERLKSCIKA